MNDMAHAALLGMTAGALIRLAREQPIIRKVYVNPGDSTVRVEFNGAHYVLTIREES